MSEFLSFNIFKSHVQLLLYQQKTHIYFNLNKQDVLMEEVTSTQFEEEQQKKSAGIPDPTNTPAKDGSKFNQNFFTRTRTTLYMIISFVLILAAGPFYSFLLIMFLNLLVFSQLNAIKRNQQKQQNIPMTKYINWYIFSAVNYYCLGIFIGHKIPILGKWYPLIGQLLAYHSFIFFVLMVIGFLGFVLSLKQGYLKYQFRLFGWIVIATLLVSMQGWLMVHNIYQGMIWYIIPSLLIICNDIFAYIVGYFFGKHQLIALSPKKTWQGYIGGAIITLFFSLILTQSLQNIQGIACPTIQPTFYPFSYPNCNSDVLLPLENHFLNTILPFTVSKLQAHILVLSLFASIIGPFGGFFASGLKRAIKIKDFANSIPGHGGVSDRMDCQIIMGAFTYFYLHTFVHTMYTSNSTFWLTLLNPSQQLILYNQLKNGLMAKGLIN